MKKIFHVNGLVSEELSVKADIAEQIFNALDMGRILVFPREISARACLAMYVKTRKKTVFTDRAVSFDTFRKSIGCFPEGLRESNAAHRLIFTNDFFESGEAAGLEYFANTAFGSAVHSYKKNIVGNLPYFRKALSLNMPDKARKDIEKILKSYDIFLNENKLYEPEYVDVDFRKLEAGKYVLVFPSCIDDALVNEALSAVDESGNAIFGLIDFNDSNAREACQDLNAIDVYGSSTAEIRSRVRALYGLLKGGIRCSDVVVTLNQMDSYLPCFVSECGKRGIPLDVQQGRPLSEYKIGSFFEDIAAVYSSDLAFEKLKKFLLNPAYLFNCRDLINKVIRFAIDCRVDGSYKLWMDKLGTAAYIAGRIDSFGNRAHLNGGAGLHSGTDPLGAAVAEKRTDPLGTTEQKSVSLGGSLPPGTSEEHKGAEPLGPAEQKSVSLGGSLPQGTAEEHKDSEPLVSEEIQRWPLTGSDMANSLEEADYMDRGFAYSAVEIDEIRRFVSDLWDYVSRICESRDAESLRGVFHTFRHRFFEDDRNQDGALFLSDVENKAAERALTEMGELEAAAAVSGRERMKDFFSLYVSLLESVVYTSNNGNGGVKVYSYPQSKGLMAPYHFVLGLSDSDVQEERRGSSFIRDPDTSGESITDATLKSYAFRSLCRVFLSCSLKNFDSVSTPPGLFVEKDLVCERRGTEADSFKAEEALWSGKPSVGQTLPETPLCSPSQRKWFFESEEKLLRGTASDSFSRLALPVTLSATSMGNYQKCPYRWYASYNYRLKKKDFGIRMSDSRQIGNLLHDAFESFYKEIGSFDDFHTRRARFTEIFDEKLEKVRRSVKAPDAVHLLELDLSRDDLLDCFPSTGVFDELLGYRTVAIEEKGLSTLHKDFRLEGYIDCVMKNDAGDYAVIDFKTRDVDSDSFQLVIYASLLKENAAYGKIPAVALFYLIKQKRYKWASGQSKKLTEDNASHFIGWKSGEGDVVYLVKASMLEDLAKRIVESCKTGAFEPRPKKDGCMYCEYRQICRKRYVIK